MARKQQKSLAKTAAALAATALIEEAKRAKAAGRKLTKAVGKRAPKLVRARSKGRKRARA